ncbi:arsenate reductase ArsC [Billgrantia sp. LNSP4103-1]|uniref:arsenate reductase ArsC n=1 Tax=Billgrantia sp. LNSP4103-1 TaxID=3410266 RepID=UPI00403FB32D
MPKPRVLFLCNANSARSLMGEALLRHMAGDRYEACSAGTEPDKPQARALAALQKQGIATEGLASKPLSDFDDEHFAAVIVLCDKAQQACRHWQGSSDEQLYWDIRDPRLLEREDAYEQALGEIRQRLSLWLAVKERENLPQR